MNYRRTMALVFALFLQVAPLVRSALPVAAPAAWAVVLRWLAAAGLVSGSFHAVSGATQITSASTARATNGVAFVYRITATGTPESFDAEPLPPGLSVDPVTGRITGKPTVTGVFTIDLSAWDGPGMTQAQVNSVLTLTVVDPPRPPKILTQPTDQSGFEGAHAALEVVAEAQPGLKYRWRKADLELAGATNSILEFKPLKAGDSGQYSVRITSTNGLFTNSVTVTLTVLPPPSGPRITAQSGDLVLHAGESVRLGVTAVDPGGAPLTYAWSREDQLLPGETSRELSLDTATGNPAGRYVATVTAGGRSTNSQPIHLTVIQPLAARPPIPTPDGFAVSFVAVPGRGYRLESTGGLSPADWALVERILPPDGQGMAVDRAPAPGARYYRLVADALASPPPP